MKLGILFIMFIVYFIFNGFWKLYAVTAYPKAYEVLKEEDERYLDFLCREMRSVKYKVARDFGLYSFFESGLCRFLTRLLGLLEILLGVFFIVLMVVMKVYELDAYWSVLL